ncbi:MAG TPA: class I SAM-dependent methyltransferase [Thermoanaerobaculia bacterium]|nr:class I SAM-dependent methyltransferase [Thermoanaerobaculia bacterium]
MDRSNSGDVATAEEVADEIELRRRFFLARLRGPVDGEELRDLTEMTTNEPAAIRYRDGVLVRDDPIRTPVRFAQDHYDERTLRRLHALHVEFFAAKTNIRDALPSGSRVLEIGSYAGGFLEVARRWRWKATGVDIGQDTAEFARAIGFDTTTERFERCGFAAESFDGVFIWNCFEQTPDPPELLARSFAVIRRGGLLALQVPDGGVYREAERAFRDGEPRIAESPIVQQLAYNNLLGFPHRFGFSEESLTRIVTAAGFELRGIRSVPAIRPLRDRLTDSAREEEARVAPAWIEALFTRPRSG